MVHMARKLKKAGLAALLALATQIPAQAHEYIDNPGGGQFTHGEVMASAPDPKVLADCLFEVKHHLQLEDKPKVVKIIRQKNKQATAAFFKLNYQGRPVTGLVIISRPAKEKPYASIFYDDDYRFPQTFGQMLNTLQGREGGNRGGGPPPQANGPVNVPLRQTIFPDGSGSAAIPPGWVIAQSSSGQAEIHGTRGERVVLSHMWACINQRIGTPLPGSMVACPIGTDLATAYQACVVADARKTGRPVPTVSNVRLFQGNDGMNFTGIRCQGDRHDGRGVSDWYIQLYRLSGMGNSWNLCAFEFCVPGGRLDMELPTLKAMRGSYHMNEGVIAQQNQAGINRQVQWFNGQQAAAQSQQDAFQTNHVDTYWANSHAQSQRFSAFSNNIRDESRIRPVDGGDGRQYNTNNNLADDLVKSGAFEYVPTNQYNVP